MEGDGPLNGAPMHLNTVLFADGFTFFAAANMLLYNSQASDQIVFQSRTRQRSPRVVMDQKVDFNLLNCPHAFKVRIEASNRVRHLIGYHHQGKPRQYCEYTDQCH
jgi:hypothetical protein